MPDATGLELIAQELREGEAGGVLDTVFFRDKASLLVAAGSVPATLEHLRGKGFGFLASVHGVDYFPEEPRLGVHYELLDMSAVDRITVATRVTVDDPHVPSVTAAWPTADHQEREVYDMFGVDLRRAPRHAAHPHARGLRRASAAPRLPDRRRVDPVHPQRAGAARLVGVRP